MLRNPTVVLLLAMLAGLVAASPPPALSGRALTRGERALLAPLFQDAVDYDAIRIVRGRGFPLQGDRTLVTVHDVVYVPPTFYSDDFARESAELRAALVHEVAHVWQYTSGVDVLGGALRALLSTRGRYARAYRYELAPGRDLLDYSIEQQATILEDYYLARGRAAARFDGVLRRFLADPRYARRRLSR